MIASCEGIVAPNLGDPTDGKFDYPSEDIRSKQTVEARRKAERNLDKFWRYVDNSFRKLTGYSQHDTIRRIFDEGGPMRRTAPWYETQEPDASLTQQDIYEYHPLSEIFHDPAKEITGNFNRHSSAHRTKEKSRGVSTADNQKVEDQDKPVRHMVKPLFHVGKDAYIVFKSLFSMPNDGELPHKIRWDQVVSALTKLGFSAEKLHGSAWQFTPKKLELSRGIQFHEPHPDGEVPLTLARRYGRRLSRAYGWDGTLFKQK